MKRGISLVCLGAAAASAQAADLHMHWQGRLLDASGTALDGPVTVQVRLYSFEAAATPTWVDDFQTTASDGYVSVELGSGEPLPLDVLANGTLWSEVAIPAGPVLGGRQRLAFAPFAGQAAAIQVVDVGPTEAQCVGQTGAIVYDRSALELLICDGALWQRVNPGDGSPEPFSFTTRSGSPGSTVTSNTVTLADFTRSRPLSVTGPAVDVLVNGVSVTIPTLVQAGDTVALRAELPADGELQWTISLGDHTTTWAARTAVEATLQLMGGTNTICSRQDSGVWCWGYSNERQGGRVGPIYSAAQVSIGPVDVLDSHHEFVCAVDAGAVKCWGANGTGQFGTGASGSANPTPQTVPGITSATDVAVGDSHGCALLANGTVSCWGQNRFGQLGRGFRDTANVQYSPQVVAGLSNVVDIDGGDLFTCALSVPSGSSGTVYCWGSDRVGQMGSNVNGASCTHSGNQYNCLTTPTAVFGMTDAVSISVGGITACAIRSNGETWCWGGNWHRDIARTDFSDSDAPLPVHADLAPADISRLVVGHEHSCALTTSGDVYCWGDRGYGKIGDGHDPYSQGGSQSSQVPFRAIQNAVDVGITRASSCAVMASGETMCWGFDAQGQCGDGSADNELKFTPVEVLDLP